MASLGYKGKEVFVYGLGKVGVATAHALSENGAKVYVWDDAEENELFESKAVSSLLSHDDVKILSPQDVNWQTLKAVFKAPGIPTNLPFFERAREKNVPILGDIDLLYKREKKATFIGITGTNGKSTTTALVGHVLEKAGKSVAVGGNLGDAALSLASKKDYYVLELSSYQLELMNEAKFERAVILNLTPDHLERHGSMEGYLAAKARLFELGGENQTRILGIDQSILALYAEKHKGLITLSTSNRVADYKVEDNGSFINKQGEEIEDLSQYPNVPGKHNWQDVAAAYLLTEGLVSKEAFFSALKTFNGLPHRMEHVLTVDNVHFINDSKATNAASTNHALSGLKNVYWLVGGRAKAEGITPCLCHLEEVQAAFVFGEAQQNFVKELSSVVPTYPCDTLERAVQAAWRTVRKDGLEEATILLSPACASWDQFESFEHRGDTFASLCREIAEANRV